MKATLTIEVPDDFEREDCEKCALSEFGYAFCPFDNCPLEIKEEPKFVVNGDMFGKYCRIPTGLSKDMHIYKIVNMIESNFWMETPITYKSENVRHETMEKVLNVIHCGVMETNVIRVALKDVEIKENTDEDQVR